MSPTDRTIPDQNGLNKFAALLMKLTKKVTKSKRFTWFDSMNDVWQTQINNAVGITQMPPRW